MNTKSWWIARGMVSKTALTWWLIGTSLGSPVLVISAVNLKNIPSTWPHCSFKSSPRLMPVLYAVIRIGFKWFADFSNSLEYSCGSNTLFLALEPFLSTLPKVLKAFNASPLILSLLKAFSFPIFLYNRDHRLYEVIFYHFPLGKFFTVCNLF